MNFFDKKNIIKAFLGLDNAGKTSLVQLLSTGVVHQVFATPIDNKHFLNDNSGIYIKYICSMITLNLPERPNYASNH